MITGIDHIALSQPFDGFDEAALFFQTVLGLRPQSSEEVASPYGLIRSRAMRAGDGVRLVLNVPLLRGGKLPETTCSQHVAFSCTDILAVARAVRSAGTPVLPMPGNYYDDLVARWGLGATQVAALREHAVLSARSWPLQFLIRRCAWHMLDHAWELQDRDLRSSQSLAS